MNREIKFRAWVTASHWIVNEQPYMAIQGAPDLETLQSFMHHYGNQPNLMQFTGLQDIDKTDLYEGDIIICFWTGLTPSNYHARSTVIEYNDGSFGYWLQGKSDFTSFECNINFKWNNNQSDRIKKIGNIYEHPELLTPNPVKPL